MPESFFLIKLQAEATFKYRFFPVNFPKYLRTPFLKGYLQWLEVFQYPKQVLSVRISPKSVYIIKLCMLFVTTIQDFSSLGFAWRDCFQRQYLSLWNLTRITFIQFRIGYLIRLLVCVARISLQVFHGRYLEKFLKIYKKTIAMRIVLKGKSKPDTIFFLKRSPSQLV